MRPALARLASLAGRLALVLLAVACAPRAAAQTPDGLANAGLTWELRGEPAQPGSVLFITVRTTSDVEAVTATAFGQTATLIQDGSARRWQGLIGVDVATTESSSLVVEARVAGGGRLITPSPLAWTPRLFRTRRLTVAGRFVDPSPAELERIRIDAERLEAIFAAVTRPERIEAFTLPVAGMPSGNFGSRSVFNGEARAPHAGEDFRGTAGTPVRAPGGGNVVLAEDLFFTGQTVVIDHGLGLYSLLAHLSRIDVAPGAYVARGDTIGLLGATGRVTGPHLHWTVRLGGARVDPLQLASLLAPAQSRAPVPRRPPTRVP